MRRLTIILASFFMGAGCVMGATAQSALGFIPIQWNARTGVLQFTLTPERMASGFLRFTGLDGGVGSMQGGGDRGTIGPFALPL